MPATTQAVFRYNLDGKTSQLVEEQGHLLSTHGRYALINSQNKLILRRTDDLGKQERSQMQRQSCRQQFRQG